MLFNSPEFAVFLIVVLALYYSLAMRAQNIMLVVVSYFFYGWWDWRFCLLLAFSTVLDFTCAQQIERARDAHRKYWLWLSLCGNLGVLGFFKYFDFFVTSATDLLTGMGLEPNPPLLNIVLPVGISFYTFQTLAYTIDVYRRRMSPTRDFVMMALYVSYFPQLVAGPIERAQNMFVQFGRARRVDERRLLTGGFLILLGLFKKLAIADAVAPRVNEIFSVAGDASWLTLLEGSWLFSLQIYGDFSGYTDIARGVSRLLGIELMVNFRQPYLSRSITEFWRRWHISLSTWLRDYLYVPLGGNRQGTLRTYANLMITMLLGGLWHGANWTFLLWGLVHGVYLAVHKCLISFRRVSDGDSARAVAGRWGWVWSLACMIATFHLVMLTWILFRSPSLEVAVDYLTGIVTLRGGLEVQRFRWMTVAFYVIVLLAIEIPQSVRRSELALLSWPWAVRGTALFLMLLLTILLRPDVEAPFIYFQF